jgi:hypothetical protein
VLFASVSVGASKFGAVLNERAAEVSEDLTSENFSRSSPPNNEIVADSLEEIVPTDVVFSATENVSDDGKVGAVVSPVNVVEFTPASAIANP